MKIRLDLGKNGYHRPSGLGGTLIVVVSECDKTLKITLFQKFNNQF